jgi:preprotein translocase subunit SecE
MNKVSSYIRESYHELVDKVTWPTWAQLQQSTAIVLVASLVIMVIVWLMDTVSNQVLQLIYSLFKS